MVAKPEFFKSAFDNLATDGYIGSPTGQPAYAYLRVSSSEQADEGRSGLPRQLQHIHEVALKNGYRVSWDLIFADDHSGFEFDSRPSLAELRQEYKSIHTKRAEAVIIEHLDRLSRNADWHQGFLLDEMKKLGLAPVFWKEFHSLIERSVIGAIAQQGMEEEKRRMMEGNLHKAKSGRVTARTPAYGYKLVDQHGNEGLAAKKDTYYAIREDEAVIVRRIFDCFINGDPLRKIAFDLEMEGIKPPKKCKNWQAVYVRNILVNEVYKGDFYAHRWHHTVIQKPSKDGFSTRPVKCKVEYPREEWIHVPVPPIVTGEEWEAANRMLEQNKKTARRNAKNPFLLTGLIKCAHCGWTYSGTTSKRCKGKERKTPYRGYRCPHYNVRPKYLEKSIECRNSHILCHVLDKVVWDVVCQALFEPQMLLEALDNDATSERNRQFEQQIAYLERELANKANDDEKLFRAYMSEAYDEHEFAARRKLLKNESAKMNEELAKLRSQVLTPEQLEQRKKAIYDMSSEMREQNIPLDPPFELKQRIIKLVVDEIILDVSNKWFELRGAVRGILPIGNTLVDMDYVPPQA